MCVHGYKHMHICVYRYFHKRIFENKEKVLLILQCQSVLVSFVENVFLCMRIRPMTSYSCLWNLASTITKELNNTLQDTFPYVSNMTVPRD